MRHIYHRGDDIIYPPLWMEADMKPISHIAQLKYLFKSINTFAQRYDNIIMLICREKKSQSSSFDNWMVLICKTLSLFRQMMFCAKFHEIGLVVLEKMWKVYRRTDTDDRLSEKVTWAFSSGELKNILIHTIQYTLTHLIYWKVGQENTLVKEATTSICSSDINAQTVSWGSSSS